MKKIKIVAAFLFIFLGMNAQQEIIDFNSGWKFHKGDVAEAYSPLFDDSGWRKLDLPHDWSIEGPFDKSNASGTGFLPGGIGWYRKSFTVPSSERKRKVYIDFGGIYNNSEVWINGTSVGKRANGYISFRYDITPYIIFGRENVIAVKADHSKFGDSRWYTGSGIYRDVRLVFSGMTHIEHWGIFASPRNVSANKADLDIVVRIRNESSKAVELSVSEYLLQGNDTVGTAHGNLSLTGGSAGEIKQAMIIKEPKLWNTVKPFLYSLVTVVNGKGVNEQQVTRVGFRDIRFDPDKGFFLNGESMKLKGICMHHDAGVLGSAVPIQEFARRLDLLKELGCNAIRTSHNPFSQEFLDLCDEKGFLVIGEAFDEWELPKKKWIEGWNKGVPGKDGYSSSFSEWHTRDLQDMILRDRNHPSIIMWSIGNEIDYPNDPYTHQILNTEANPQTWAKYDKNLPDAKRLGEIARELAGIVRDLDKTRPVTAGLASALMSNESGYSDALDVCGYNYQEFRYAPDHKKYPSRILYGSENGMALEAWNAVTENEYVMGQFLWTGIEYLGEAGQFPSRHSTSGLIDLAGNRKPEFYFRQSLWSEKPMIFIGTTDRSGNQGTASLWAHKRVDPVWNYKDGQPVSVNIFTNCEEAELFLNDRSLGIKKMSEFTNRTITWEVPYEAGILKAVGRKGDKQLAEYHLATSGNPYRINVSIKESEHHDGGLLYVYAELYDKSGNVVYNAENEITCEISGNLKLLGMEDANPRNIEDYKDNRQHAYHGKLLLYLQETGRPGNASIKLSSPGLKSTEISIP